MSNINNQNDYNALNTFIHNIFKDGDGYIELRPCRDRGTGIDVRARRWYATPQAFCDVAPSIISYCRRKALGCFIGLLPRDESGHGSAQYVNFGRVVWADIDAKDFAGGKHEALAKIVALELEPCAVVESGGGYHIYYFLDDATPPATIERANKRLAAIVGGDHCHDRARVLRLPLSYHCKTERVYKLKFLTLQSDVYSVASLLEAWPALVDEQAELKFEEVKTDYQPNARMVESVATLMQNNEVLRELYNGFGKVGGDMTGSGYDYAFAREAIYLGGTFDDVCDAVAHRVQSRGKKVRDTYIQSTVSKAKASVDAYKAKAATSTPTPSTASTPTPVNQYTLERLAKYPKGTARAGQYLKSRSNLAIILEHDDAYADKIKYNSFKNRIEYGDQILHDRHITAIALEIERAYGLAYAIAMLENTVVYQAHQNTFHPVQNYLMALPQNNTTILDNWMHLAFGTPNDELHKAIGRKWAIGAAKRIVNPGVFVKNMLILEGAQNVGKSSAIKILAKNPLWYRDTPFNIRRDDARDAYTKIRGAWLYELPEMRSFDGVDANTVKAFVSSTTDSYRRVYERFEVDVPRQCVFIGTTNNKAILNDATGNVRFWPVHVEHVDFDWLEQNVDAIWSAAMAHIDESHELPHELEAHMLEQVDEYEASDERIHKIIDWYHDNLLEFTTITEILQEALMMAPKDCTRKLQMEFAELLTQAGWESARRQVNGKRQRVWWQND